MCRPSTTEIRSGEGVHGAFLYINIENDNESGCVEDSAVVRVIKGPSRVDPHSVHGKQAFGGVQARRM